MKKYITLIILIGLIITACGLNKDKEKDGGLNLFPVSKDIELGAQVAKELESNSSEYPILDSASNVAAYRYIYGIRNKILATGKVKHKDDLSIYT